MPPSRPSATASRFLGRSFHRPTRMPRFRSPPSIGGHPQPVRQLIGGARIGAYGFVGRGLRDARPKPCRFRVRSCAAWPGPYRGAPAPRPAPTHRLRRSIPLPSPVLYQSARRLGRAYRDPRSWRLEGEHALYLWKPPLERSIKVSEGPMRGIHAHGQTMSVTPLLTRPTERRGLNHLVDHSSDQSLREAEEQVR